MKSLQINPLSHEIEFYPCLLGDGLADVNFVLPEAKGHVVLNEAEAQKIGNWFLKLAMEIKKHEQKS